MPDARRRTILSRIKDEPDPHHPLRDIIAEHVKLLGRLRPNTLQYSAHGSSNVMAELAHCFVDQPSSHISDIQTPTVSDMFPNNRPIVAITAGDRASEFMKRLRKEVSVIFNETVNKEITHSLEIIVSEYMPRLLRPTAEQSLLTEIDFPMDKVIEATYHIGAMVRVSELALHDPQTLQRYHDRFIATKESILLSIYMTGIIVAIDQSRNLHTLMERHPATIGHSDAAGLVMSAVHRPFEWVADIAHMARAYMQSDELVMVIPDGMRKYDQVKVTGVTVVSPPSIPRQDGVREHPLDRTFCAGLYTCMGADSHGNLQETRVTIPALDKTVPLYLDSVKWFGIWDSTLSRFSTAQTFTLAEGRRFIIGDSTLASILDARGEGTIISSGLAILAGIWRASTDQIMPYRDGNGPTVREFLNVMHCTDGVVNSPNIRNDRFATELHVAGVARSQLIMNQQFGADVRSRTRDVERHRDFVAKVEKTVTTIVTMLSRLQAGNAFGETVAAATLNNAHADVNGTDLTNFVQRTQYIQKALRFIVGSRTRPYAAFTGYMMLAAMAYQPLKAPLLAYLGRVSTNDINVFAVDEKLPDYDEKNLTIYDDFDPIIAATAVGSLVGEIFSVGSFFDGSLGTAAPVRQELGKLSTVLTAQAADNVGRAYNLITQNGGLGTRGVSVSAVGRLQSMKQQDIVKASVNRKLNLLVDMYSSREVPAVDLPTLAINQYILMAVANSTYPASIILDYLVRQGSSSLLATPHETIMRNFDALRDAALSYSGKSTTILDQVYMSKAGMFFDAMYKWKVPVPMKPVFFWPKVEMTTHGALVCGRKAIKLDRTTIFAKKAFTAHNQEVQVALLTRSTVKMIQKPLYVPILALAEPVNAAINLVDVTSTTQVDSIREGRTLGKTIVFPIPVNMELQSVIGIKKGLNPVLDVFARLYGIRDMDMTISDQPVTRPHSSVYMELAHVANPGPMYRNSALHHPPGSRKLAELNPFGGRFVQHYDGMASSV